MTLALPTESTRLALLASAREARENAHAPYSKFTVGAALLTRSGKIFQGCNVEMAADSGTCAEGVAVANAITQGALAEGQSFIHAIAITTRNKACSGDALSIANASACGICRQVLHDFAEAEACWLILDDEASGVPVLLKDLLPYGFRLGEVGAVTAPETCAELEASAVADQSSGNLLDVAGLASLYAASHTRHQPEGAVILTTDGRAFCGVSVENSNANHYTRALAVACNRAVLAGAKPKFVKALALYTTLPRGHAVSPAVFDEFVCEGAKVLISHAEEGEIIVPRYFIGGSFVPSLPPEFRVTE